MTLHYYPEIDGLYIGLKHEPGSESCDIGAELVVDLDANSDMVGLDTDPASR